MKVTGRELPLRRFIAAIFYITVFMLSACSTNTIKLAEDENFVVLIAGHGDSLRSLAKLYLGDESMYWLIADINGVREVETGQELLIPLKIDNPTGVFVDGYQTIPILAYHRVSRKFTGKMSVSIEMFDEQMSYLKRNDYRVITLSEMIPFLRGERPIPRRAVIITFDDGHHTIYQNAFPILKKYGFPATLFVYSDYINKGGLTWRQIDEMTSSGLISLQSHSKSHTNLAIRLDDEDEARYHSRVLQEIVLPPELMEKRVAARVFGYAYPYGDTNDYVIEQLKKHGYELGLTVYPGGNPAFGNPFLLRRAMIFGDEGMEAFREELKTFRTVDLH